MNRTNFLAAASVVGISALGSRSANAAQVAVPGGTDLVERRTSFDAAAFDATFGKAADIRQLWENLALKPSVFNNIKNALNGLEFGFGYPAGRVMHAVANHGPSSAYTYSDEIWSKYRIGEFFKVMDKNGALVTTNIFLPKKNAPSTSTETDPDDEKGPYQDTGIAALQERGVVFMTCHTAVEEQSRALVAAGHAPSGMSGSDVAADILTHLIPGAVVVPSMVATIAVLQHRFKYTYITIQS